MPVPAPPAVLEPDARAAKAVLGRISAGGTSSYSVWKVWTYDAGGRVTGEVTVGQGSGLLFQSSRMVHDAEQLLQRAGFTTERLVRTHGAYVLEWRLSPAVAPPRHGTAGAIEVDASGRPAQAGDEAWSEGGDAGTGTEGAAGAPPRQAQTCPPRLLSAV